MVYRCYLTCPHYSDPCEISVAEMDKLIGRSTPCPVGEPDGFYLSNEENEFFCMIVGSRSFENYEILREKCDFMLKKKTGKEIIIVSGGAAGADALAKNYAKEKGYKYLEFPADWSKGNIAGYERNQQMHRYISTKADRGVIAFWDGESKGTKHSFSLAKKFHNPIRIIKVDSEN